MRREELLNKAAGIGVEEQVEQEFVLEKNDRVVDHLAFPYLGNGSFIGNFNKVKDQQGLTQLGRSVLDVYSILLALKKSLEKSSEQTFNSLASYPQFSELDIKTKQITEIKEHLRESFFAFFKEKKRSYNAIVEGLDAKLNQEFFEELLDCVAKINWTYYRLLSETSSRGVDFDALKDTAVTRARDDIERLFKGVDIKLNSDKGVCDIKELFRSAFTVEVDAQEDEESKIGGAVTVGQSHANPAFCGIKLDQEKIANIFVAYSNGCPAGEHEDVGISPALAGVVCLSPAASSKKVASVTRSNKKNSHFHTSADEVRITEIVALSCLFSHYFRTFLKVGGANLKGDARDELFSALVAAEFKDNLTDCAGKLWERKKFKETNHIISNILGINTTISKNRCQQDLEAVELEIARAEKLATIINSFQNPLDTSGQRLSVVYSLKPKSNIEDFRVLAKKILENKEVEGVKSKIEELFSSDVLADESLLTKEVFSLYEKQAYYTKLRMCKWPPEANEKKAGYKEKLSAALMKYYRSESSGKNALTAYGNLFSAFGGESKKEAMSEFIAEWEVYKKVYLIKKMEEHLGEESADIDETNRAVVRKRYKELLDALRLQFPEMGEQEIILKIVESEDLNKDLVKNFRHESFLIKLQHKVSSLREHFGEKTEDNKELLNRKILFYKVSLEGDGSLVVEEVASLLDYQVGMRGANKGEYEEKLTSLITDLFKTYGKQLFALAEKVQVNLSIFEQSRILFVDAPIVQIDEFCENVDLFREFANYFRISLSDLAMFFRKNKLDIVPPMLLPDLYQEEISDEMSLIRPQTKVEGAMKAAAKMRTEILHQEILSSFSNLAFYNDADLGGVFKQTDLGLSLIDPAGYDIRPELAGKLAKVGFKYRFLGSVYLLSEEGIGQIQRAGGIYAMIDGIAKKSDTKTGRRDDSSENGSESNSNSNSNGISKKKVSSISIGQSAPLTSVLDRRAALEGVSDSESEKSDWSDDDYDGNKITTSDDLNQYLGSVVEALKNNSLDEMKEAVDIFVRKILAGKDRLTAAESAEFIKKIASICQKEDIGSIEQATKELQKYVSQIYKSTKIVESEEKFWQAAKVKVRGKLPLGVAAACRDILKSLLEFEESQVEWEQILQLSHNKYVQDLAELEKIIDDWLEFDRLLRRESKSVDLQGVIKRTKEKANEIGERLQKCLDALEVNKIGKYTHITLNVVLSNFEAQRVGDQIEWQEKATRNKSDERFADMFACLQQDLGEALPVENKVPPTGRRASIVMTGSSPSEVSGNNLAAMIAARNLQTAGQGLPSVRAATPEKRQIGLEALLQRRAQENGGDAAAEAKPSLMPVEEKTMPSVRAATPEKGQVGLGALMQRRAQEIRGGAGDTLGKEEKASEGRPNPMHGALLRQIRREEDPIDRSEETSAAKDKANKFGALNAMFANRAAGTAPVPMRRASMPSLSRQDTVVKQGVEFLKRPNNEEYSFKAYLRHIAPKDADQILRSVSSQVKKISYISSCCSLSDMDSGDFSDPYKRLSDDLGMVAQSMRDIGEDEYVAHFLASEPLSRRMLSRHFTEYAKQTYSRYEDSLRKSVEDYNIFYGMAGSLGHVSVVRMAREYIQKESEILYGQAMDAYHACCQAMRSFGYEADQSIIYRYMHKGLGDNRELPAGLIDELEISRGRSAGSKGDSLLLQAFDLVAQEEVSKQRERREISRVASFQDLQLVSDNPGEKLNSKTKFDWLNIFQDEGAKDDAKSAYSDLKRKRYGTVVPREDEYLQYWQKICMLSCLNLIKQVSESDIEGKEDLFKNMSRSFCVMSEEDLAQHKKLETKLLRSKKFNMYISPEDQSSVNMSSLILERQSDLKDALGRAGYDAISQALEEAVQNVTKQRGFTSEIGSNGVACEASI